MVYWKLVGGILYGVSGGEGGWGVGSLFKVWVACRLKLMCVGGRGGAG